MNARPRAFDWLPSTILATAALLGLIAALQPLIAVAAVAAIVLAYVVFNDLAAGFAVLAFLSFLETLPASSSLSPAKGAGLLVAIAWLARFSSSAREQGDLFADHPFLSWSLIGFFVWATVSLLWSTSLGVGVESLTRYAPNILLLPIAYTAIRNRRDLMLVVVAIVLGAILAAVFGVLQPPSPDVITESSRATGTVGDPNELAAFLLIGLALAGGVALKRGGSPLLRTTAIFALPLCLAGIFLSLSRGGLVALGVMMIAGTLFAGRWRVAIAIVLVVVAAGGIFYFAELASLPAREHVTTAGGGAGRSDIWKLGLRMVRAHPIEGVGVGNFPIVSPNYALQPGTLQRADLIFSSAPKVTHNTYLEVMSEMGIPGFLLFVSAVLSCLVCALKAASTWARLGERNLEAIARAVFLGLVGMLAADFFISEMYSKLLWVMLAMCPALLGIARREQRERKEAESAAEPAVLTPV
ncbi:MAG TPA: O-antigen ligase family protein [Solirubrobacteraceae bacterium]|nr:O-antigen ligase family protein [Solirubrobacteraceae bacterium]